MFNDLHELEKDISTFRQGQLDCVQLRGDAKEHVVHLQHQK